MESMTVTGSTKAWVASKPQTRYQRESLPIQQLYPNSADSSLASASVDHLSSSTNTITMQNTLTGPITPPGSGDEARINFQVQLSDDQLPNLTSDILRREMQKGGVVARDFGSEDHSNVTESGEQPDMGTDPHAGEQPWEILGRGASLGQFEEVLDYLEAQKRKLLDLSEKLDSGGESSQTASRSGNFWTYIANQAARTAASKPNTRLTSRTQNQKSEAFAQEETTPDHSITSPVFTHFETAYIKPNEGMKLDTSIRRPRGSTPMPMRDADDTANPPRNSPPRSEVVPTIIKTTIEVVMKLREVFPAEARALKRYLKNPELVWGDRLSRIQWDQGVSALVSSDGHGPSLASGPNTTGLHIFLDHSNIFLSFLATLQEASKKEPQTPAGRRRTLSLPILTLLLTRGRTPSPKGMHLVGSTPLMQRLEPAIRLGWQVSVLQRVPVSSHDTDDNIHLDRSTRGKTSNSSGKQQESTDSDAVDMCLSNPALLARRMREQAVDEVLHLKILQTLLLAKKPGTIVLATGDANRSPFNEQGFLGCVRQALQRGWHVELWAFKNGLARAWEDTAKREKWTENGRFVLWLLDPWLPYLTETA